MLVSKLPILSQIVFGEFDSYAQLLSPQVAAHDLCIHDTGPVTHPKFPFGEFVNSLTNLIDYVSNLPFSESSPFQVA